MENFRKEELIIPMAKAQVHALLYFFPFALLFGIPYYLLWSSAFTKDAFKSLLSGFGLWSIAILFFIIIAGIVVHEFLHGITWAAFSKEGYRSIKYGVMWKYLTPYCHCKERLLVKHYIAGALMPGIALGIIPSILSIITGDFGLFIFGLFFTLAAGGDLMIVNLLRKEPMDNLVQDHPSKIGCYIYRPITE